MQQEALVPSSALDYRTVSADRRPLRAWVPAVFLAVVIGGELLGVERLYRWHWPMLGDYMLGALLLSGAIVGALVTRVPGWLLGFYGLVGLCFFYPGETITREFKLGIAEPGAIRLHVIRWSCALFAAWLACRSTALLRRKPPAA